MNANILLVEDDVSLGHMLTEYLTLKGFNVMWEKKFGDALEVINRTEADLCLLDVTLPEKDGFILAAEIKKMDPHVPIVFLTSRSMKVDILRGFKQGADDYITKPVDEEELVARLEAILKRTEKVRHHYEEDQQIGRLTFSPSLQQLRRDEEIVGLTKRESQLLSMLCEDREQLIPTDRILRELWGRNDFFNRRSMDVFISRLRKKLLLDPTLQIDNVHGKGFILRQNAK